jgi:hypothetical protein
MPFITIIAGILTLFVVVSLILNFEVFLVILQYAVFIAIGLGALLLLYVIVRIISAISSLFSQASLERAVARQQKEKVRMQVERRILARQAYIVPSEPRDEYQQIPRRTKKLPARTLISESSQDDTLLQEPPPVPGMPEKGQVFLYQNYQRSVAPGELIIGVRRDGTVRRGTWQDFKVLLILGNSASGKTNTIVEKCVGAASGGGWLVICDPHGYKPDSLLRRVYPLQGALMPGTVFALEHADILRNVQIVKRELEKRVHGGNCDKPIFLVVEEFNRLQRDKDIADELKLILQIIGQEGRGFNVYAIVGAQQITYKADVRKAFISVVCHRVDESESKLCIPARYAKYTLELGTGQTFVKDADGRTEPLQQVLITVEDVQRVSSRLAAMKQHESRHSRAPFPQRRTTRVLKPQQLQQQQPPIPQAAIQRAPIPSDWTTEAVTDISAPIPVVGRSDGGDRVQQQQASTAQDKLDLLARQRRQRHQSK